MTEEGGKRSGNGMLVGILSFLVLVIVGLIIGIFVVKINKDNMPNEPQQGETEEGVPRNPVSLSSGIYDKADDVLTEGGQNAYDEAMKYFDDAVSSVSDDDTVFELESMRINVLIEYEYFDDALEYIKKIDKSDLDIFKQCSVLSFYKVTYEGLGDVEKVSEYEKLLKDAEDKLNSVMSEGQEETNE